ncbi:MAG: hypothetical protein IPG71_14125 [bacterium]|nr:hypothetical protein [bacterium]
MMKSLIILGIMAGWVGCSWTPDRLNPYDPESESYVKPAQTNRPPEIDTLIVNTECINLPINDDCSIIIKAAISDLDSNVRLNEVLATINGIGFGQLSYDSPNRIWTLRRQETELDSAAERYVGSVVQVTAVDDSGAIGQRSLLFPRCLSTIRASIGRMTSTASALTIQISPGTAGTARAIRATTKYAITSPIRSSFPI